MRSLNLLKRIALFRTLTDSELRKISEVAGTRKCRRGETIIEEGARNGCIFAVLKGELKVTHLVRGRRRELGTFRVGDHFGELAFIDNKPRSATIYSATSSELL